jgi:two-component system sensor histidine kinase NblS
MCKSKVVNNLIHEIKSPLFNIKSFLETLYEYYFQLTDTQILEFLEIANQETSRLGRLISNSLDLSSLNSYRVVPYHLVFVENLVNQVIKSYEITRLQKNIFFCIKIPFIIPKFLGNYDLILQVLSNLISNSLKFTYPSGSVVLRLRVLNSLSVKTRRKSFLLRIDLMDDGIGISKVKVGDLFHRSKQISPSKYYLDGLGLGLSIIKDLMDNQSKYIHLISTSSRGTCAIINF